jgi:hypothetical protein
MTSLPTLTWNKRRKAFFCFYFDKSGDGAHEFMGMGRIGGKFVGFHVIGTTLWARVSDGTNITEIEMGTVAIQTYYQCRIDFLPNDKVHFVFGQLTLNVTTNMPTGLDDANVFPSIEASTDDATVNALVRCNEARFVQFP